MNYVYESHKPWLFTDEGQRALLAARRHLYRLVRESGAAMSCKVFDVHTGDSWKTMSLLERLVELGDFRLIQQWPGCAWQEQIIVPGPIFEELA